MSIRCSAVGYPKPTVVWTHNDMFIVGSSRYGLKLSQFLFIFSLCEKEVLKDAKIF